MFFHRHTRQVLLVVSLIAFAPAAAALAGTMGADATTLKALEDDIFGRYFQAPTRVGEEINLTMRSPAGRPFKAGIDSLVWSQEIHYAEASYIAPHFARFDLPPGAAVIVRSPDGSRHWRFTGTGKGRLGLTAGFWGIHIAGDSAVVELWSSVPVNAGAVVIDRFAWGYQQALPLSEPLQEPEAICGTDNSVWAKCLQSSEPNIYDKSRAVARLLINGTGACTGWLVGSAGHLITNEHCIGSAAAAANTNYEFMAEGATCSTGCASWFACPGTVVAVSATAVRINAALDYALVQLPSNPTGSYGYFQLRNSGAVVNERIYLPGHPAGWGKRISDASTHSSDPSGKCEVYSLSEPPCSGGPGDVGYFCDTQGGSSGSPVVGYGDQLVVALHHCSNCPNRGVPIQSVISDLGGSLPPNALPTTMPPGYVGCFTDDPNRALPVWLGNVGDIESCINRARANGLAYAGLQWYGECWGGNQLGYTQVGDGECNTPCASGQMCGGGWRNSIYGTGVVPPARMQQDSAVRGCDGWWWWNPVYQPNPDACYDYCAQNGANACEWNVNGDCYVEFGTGCYVQAGFPGWWAAVF